MKLILPIILCLSGFSLFLVLHSCNKEDESSPMLKILPRNDYEGTGANQILDVTISLTTPASLPVSLKCSTVDSTAKAGKDFIPIADSTIIFNPGETSKTINIEIISDSSVEYKEYFKVMISDVENAGVLNSSLTIYIANDDYIKPVLLPDGYGIPDTLPGMMLVYDEEFNTPYFDFATWDYDAGGGGWGLGQLQEYTTNPENLSLTNGKLTITALDDGGKLTSARINTSDKRTFQYGLITFRAKMPSGRGIWPAIWLLGAECDGSNYPACGEIDIAELNGLAPGTLIGAAYYNEGGPREKAGTCNLPGAGASYADQFHVFSILWQQDKIEWLMDDRVYLSFEKADVGQGWPFNNNFFLYINLAVGGTLVGPPDNSTEFPQSLQVDYIRVFRPA